SGRCERGAASRVRGSMLFALGLVIGILLGGDAAWLVARARVGPLAAQAARADAVGQELATTRTELARLETTLEYERLAAEEKLAVVEQAREQLSAAFKALSSEALQSNSSSFLELARTTLERFQVQARGDRAQRGQAVEQLVMPIAQSLEKVDGKINQLEQARREAYGAIREQVRTLAEGQERLRTETGNLVTALRAPATRGRWGEIQLR